MRRQVGLVLWPAGLAFGVAAEWIGRPELVVLDAVAGFVLVSGGLLAWSRRPDSSVGTLLVAAGGAWFLGTIWAPAVFLHRGPLAHLLLSYPTGRRLSRLERGAVGAAYVYAAVRTIAANDYATFAFAFGLAALSLRRYAVASAPERRARVAPLVATTAFALVLTVDGVARVDALGYDRAALVAYDLAVCLVALGLFADLLWGRWTQSAVTGLVVDLGEEAAGSRPLRDRLARTLGDPTLVVGYWLPETNCYVDEVGRRVDLPAASADRTVTPVEEHGAPVAVLVHDRAVLDDPRLLSAVASATRLAVSNARLEADVRTRVVEVEESRRRIVEASDRQRQRFEQELRDGAEQRLARVAQLLGESGDPLAEISADLGAAQAELREFARGIRPRTLTEHGLRAAIEELAERSPVRIELNVTPERLPPPVEHAAYFVCSESAANVAKYADASHIEIAVVQKGGWLTVAVSDYGVGGADPSRGSGLRGLSDRVEALGGRMRVESPPGGGTRIVAEVPLEQSGSQPVNEGAQQEAGGSAR